MKLDAYVMREAVRARDKEAILDLFQQHFAPIGLYREQSWLMLSAPWLSGAQVAIRVYGLAYRWHPDIGFYEEELFSLAQQTLPYIHVHPGLWGKKQS